MYHAGDMVFMTLLPLRSLFFWGGGDFKTREKREKKKREKRTPSRKFATPVRGKGRKVTTHDSSLSERERERERERKRKRKRKSVRHALITAPRSERAERGVDIQRKRERESVREGNSYASSCRPIKGKRERNASAN